MMTREHFFALLIFSFWGIAAMADGKPMDARAAQDIPKMKLLVQAVQTQKQLSPEELKSLHSALRSGDPVLTSIASWCVMHMGAQADSFAPDLGAVTEASGDMPFAFSRLAAEWRKIEKLSLSEKVTRLLAISNTKNHYLNIEALKVLSGLDKEAAREALSKIASIPNTKAGHEAAIALRKIDKRNATSHTDDELYETLLSVIEPQ